MAFEAIPVPPGIDKEHLYDHVQTLIPQDEYLHGVDYLVRQFHRIAPDPSAVSVVPIMTGGLVMAQFIAQESNLTLNPMEMSKYPAGKQMNDSAQWKGGPDIDLIVGENSIKPVVFVEAITDTGDTARKAFAQVKRQIAERLQELNRNGELPKMYLLSLMTKLDAANLQELELIASFFIDPNIWVAGGGCDLEGKGRELERIVGIVSPYATEQPQKPYYRKLF